MRRIGLAVVVAVSLALAPLAAAAPKVYRLGILTAGRALPFEQELRKLGYIENQNIVIVRGILADAFSSLPSLQARLWRSGLM
jgi:hypothetical protein